MEIALRIPHVRAPKSPVDFTNPDHPHMGLPSQLPPSAGPHFSSTWDPQFVLEQHCQCAGLQFCCSSGWTSLTHSADLSPALSPASSRASSLGWTSLTHFVALSPTLSLAPSHFVPDLAPWMDSSPGLLLVVSGTVKGPCHWCSALSVTLKSLRTAPRQRVHGLLPYLQ